MRKKGTTQTPEILKEAFWTLYSQKELNKIKIGEITDLAGFNRGAFYNYYKNVYDIFNRIETDVMDEISNIAWHIQDFIMDDDLSDKKLRPILELYQKNEKYLKVLFTKEDNPRFMYRLKKLIRSRMLESIKNTKNSVDPKYIDYYVEYYVSGQINIIIYWFTKGSHIPVEEFSTIVKEIATKGAVSTLKKILYK